MATMYYNEKNATKGQTHIGWTELLVWPLLSPTVRINYTAVNLHKLHSAFHIAWTRGSCSFLNSVQVLGWKLSPVVFYR